MTIKTAPIPSGASGLPLRTAAPTVNTRQNVPIASTTYFTSVRGEAATAIVSPAIIALFGAWDVTMDPRIAVATADVVKADAQRPFPPVEPHLYQPAAISVPTGVRATFARLRFR
jgi:hypothetical protein